jgi:hypothetical protein
MLKYTWEPQPRLFACTQSFEARHLPRQCPQGTSQKGYPCKRVRQRCKDRNDAGSGSRLLALQLNQRALGKVVVVQFGLHNVVY